MRKTGHEEIQKKNGQYIKTVHYYQIQDQHYNSAFVLEDTVGQYTGLKDKNGKKIFEGDIVKIPNDYEEYGVNAGELYEIYFAFGGFRLKPKYKRKAKGYWLEDNEELEVIRKYPR